MAERDGGDRISVISPVERSPFLKRSEKEPEFLQFMSELKAQFEKYKSEFAP